MSFQIAYWLVCRNTFLSKCSDPIRRAFIKLLNRFQMTKNCWQHKNVSSTNSKESIIVFCSHPHWQHYFWLTKTTICLLLTLILLISKNTNLLILLTIASNLSPFYQQQLLIRKQKNLSLTIFEIDYLLILYP